MVSAGSQAKAAAKALGRGAQRRVGHGHRLRQHPARILLISLQVLHVQPDALACKQPFEFDDLDQQQGAGQLGRIEGGCAGGRRVHGCFRCFDLNVLSFRPADTSATRYTVGP